jgi:dGTP triphosphohydrolase
MQDQTQLNDFLASQAGQRAMQEHQQELAGKRKELADQLADLKKRRATELAPLEDGADAAMIACEQARKSFEQAELHRRTADSELNKVRSSYAARVRSIESQIIRTAPPEIDAFIDESRAEIERMQKSRISVTGDGKRSNRLSFEAKMAALRRSIDDAQKLKAKFMDGLPARLDRMRSAIPELALAITTPRVG